MKQHYYTTKSEFLFNSNFKSFSLLLLFLVASLGYGQTVTLGSGTNATGQYDSGPVSQWYKYTRFQVVYTAAELIAAGAPAGGGPITSFGWNVAVAPNNPIPNYSIRMAHTIETNSANYNNAALTTVYGALNTTFVTGFNLLTLTGAGFIWNGTSNLLVDVCNSGAAQWSSPYGQVYTYAPTTTNGSRSSRSDSATRCATNTDVKNTFKPQARFVFPSFTPCSGTPLGGNLTVSPNSGNPGSNYGVTAIGYTSGTGLTYRWQFSDNGGGTWANQGPLTTSYTPLSGMVAPALGVVRTWRLLVTCTAGSSAYSSTATFTSAISYCVPTGGTSSTNYYLNSITSTLGVTNINYTASSYNAYVNNSATTFSQLPGNPVTVNMASPSGSTYYYYCWVDWNNDGDFTDAGETIWATTTYAATYSGSIPVAITQAAGNYRVRFGTSYIGALDSCGPSPWGNYVDYTLSVISLSPCTGSPAGGAVTVSPTSGNPDSSYNVNASGFTVGTGLTYQWQYSDTNGSTWNNVGIATSSYAGLTGQIAPALGIVRTWRLVVTCTAGSSANSTTGTFTSVISYCSPTSTYTGDYIRDFSTTGGVTNISNTNSGFSAPGYGDFYSAYSASQLAGGTLNFLETYAGGNHGLSIWVDLNKNGTFEASERLFNATSTANGHTGTITIPGITTPGDYRMRVRAWYGNLNPDPCDNQTYGEAEDYKLTVLSASPCTEPTAQATNLVLSVSGTTINGTFTAASPAPDSYLVVYNTTGTTPNPVDSTSYTIGGTVGAGNIVGDIDGNTNFSVSGLAANTPYYFFVFSYNNSACLANYLNLDPLTNTATTGVSYCTTGFTYVEPITNVTFAGINNTSSASTTSPAYEDFTAISATVNLDTPYPISLKGNTDGPYTSYFTVFIDWNQDGNFDANETFEIGSITSSTGVDAKVLNGTINVPDDALPGSTRMRVIKNFNSSPTNPCISYTFGQAEDYTVNVIPPLPPTITSFPSDACAGSSIVITGTSLNFATGVTVGGTAATITDNTATTITVTLGNGATGLVEVTTAVGTGTSTTSITVNPAPNRPPPITFPLPPYCDSLIFSYTTTGTVPSNIKYYWQTVPLGTSTANSDPDYTITTLGFNTIYLRAYNTDTGCWSILDRQVSKTLLGSDAVVTDPIPANGASGICFAGLGATPSLNWASLGTGYTYHVYFGTSPTSPPFVGDRTTNSYPIATGLLSPNTTYYWYVVPESVCGLSTGTPVTYSFTTNSAACYCTPTIVGYNPGITYFNQVAFLGTLNDVTQNSTFSTSPNGYQDFTASPNISQQAQGEGMNVYFRSTYRGIVKAWVDWNRDGVFSGAAELVYTARVPPPGTLAASGTIGIKIAANRTVGFYRLRIRIDDEDNWNSFDFGPCDNINYYGETEDYLFEVVRNCEARITAITDGETCGLPLGGNVSVPLSVGVTANSTEVRWYSELTGGVLLNTTAVVGGTSSSWTPSIGTTTTYYVTAYEVNNCESLVRTPIVAKVKPVANITYTPTNPESCGEDSVVTLTASGDNEVVNLIDEGFETNANGGLGVFTAQNLNSGGNYALAGWKRRTSLFIPNEQSWRPAISSGFGNDKFAMATSDVGSGSYDNALVSPVRSTMTFLDLTLTFRMYYSDYHPSPGSDQVTLEVSTDGGTNWIVEHTYNEPIGIGTQFALQTYDFVDYLNEPNFRFRIRYTSLWTDGVAIDDIKLTGTKPLVPSFSWTGVPAVAAYTDYAATIPYVTGTPAPTVYIKPTLAQLELGTYNFTAIATLTNGCNTSQPITITNKSKIWKGTYSEDWNNDNNWLPIGAPTADNCVVISSVVKIPRTGIPTPPVGYFATAKNLTIKSTGNLELLSRNNLTVTDWIHNEGTDNFDIRSEASLLQVNNDVNIGAMKMNRVASVKKTDYVYYSSPVEGYSFADLSPLTPSGVKFRWLPTTVAGDGFVYGNWYRPGAEIMGLGTGYIVRGPTAWTTPQELTASFLGVPRNGNVVVPITRGNYMGANTTHDDRIVTKDDDNYNLIGNPYPSAIDATKFLNNTQNNNIEGTVYLWPHGGMYSESNPNPFYQNYAYNYNSEDYITWNAVGSVPSATFSGYIAAGQAFFVLMTDAGSTSENLYFNNTMRVTGNNSEFLRLPNESAVLESDATLSQPQRIYLDLVQPNGKTSSILVGYIEGATNDRDRLYDSPIIDTSTQNLYSKIGEESMIIQGRPMPLDQNDQVPLGVLIPQQGIYTVAINNVDGIFLDADQDIYLEDRVTGMIYDLKNAPYTFTANPGRYDDRFVLRYNADATLGMPEIGSNSGLNIVKFKSIIKVTSENSPIESIVVYDALGRLIFDFKKVNNNEFKIPLDNLSEGTFIVKATLQNGNQQTKKVIY